MTDSILSTSLFAQSVSPRSIFTIFIYIRSLLDYFYLIYLQFIHFFKPISTGLLIFLSSIRNLSTCSQLERNKIQYN